MVERFREQLSNENVAERIARMVAQLDQAAHGVPEPGRALQSSGEQTPAAAEQARLSLAFSQDTLSGARASTAKARTSRRATGRRPGL
jgi:ATP-dependent Lhr-like helicase